MTTTNSNTPVAEHNVIFVFVAKDPGFGWFGEGVAGKGSFSIVLFILEENDVCFGGMETSAVLLVGFGTAGGLGILARKISYPIGRKRTITTTIHARWESATFLEN